MLEQHESIGLERTATSKGGTNICDASVTATAADVTLADYADVDLHVTLGIGERTFGPEWKVSERLSPEPETAR